MAGKLDNKVALVTGGARGIGAASALRMASEGATVVVSDILEQEARAVVEGITGAGGRASFVALNVTQEDAWVAGVAQVKETYGGLHILLNNAGLGLPSPLIETDYGMFRKLFSINLDGMFLGMKHSIPLIAQSGGGSIINVSSAAAMKVYANMSTYCASKAAVAQLTKAAALECASAKIRVNSLHPGLVDTAAWDGLRENPDTPVDLGAMAAATVPLGYAAIPDDIANAVIFLASNDSRYVTGIELVVDGGAILL